MPAEAAERFGRISLSSERDRRRRAELEFLAGLTDTALAAADHATSSACSTSSRP
jgi:hypothetical protein